MSCQFAHCPGTNGRSGSAVTRGLWSQQPGGSQSPRSVGSRAGWGRTQAFICVGEALTCVGLVMVETLSHALHSTRDRSPFCRGSCGPHKKQRSDNIACHRGLGLGHKTHPFPWAAIGQGALGRPYSKHTLEHYLVYHRNGILRPA